MSNLERLIEQMKVPPYVHHDGHNIINWETIVAKGKFYNLFEKHGPALVEALRNLVSKSHTPETYVEDYDRAKKLLTQLEQEAGG